MAVQNPPVKGGFEPPVMSFSAVVFPRPSEWILLSVSCSMVNLARSALRQAYTISKLKTLLSILT
jgi:hypothetical protein